MEDLMTLPNWKIDLIGLWLLTCVLGYAEWGM